MTDQKEKDGSDSSKSAHPDPFEELYLAVLNLFPEASFKVEITKGGIWFCDVTVHAGMCNVQWHPKHKKYGVSDIPGDGGFTHQPDLAFDTVEEARGAVLAFLWRKKTDLELSGKEGR